MEKYKCLKEEGWGIGYKQNKIYSYPWIKVWALNYPDDWQLIQEESMCEKTIKLSLDQARKMYGKNPEIDELLLANFSKEELTKKELPKIIINGHSAEFFDNYIKFGCAKIEKNIVLAIHNLMSLQEGDTYPYKGITQITFGNGTMTSDQVDKIVKYYLKK